MEEPTYPNSADGYTLVELIGKGMFNNEVWRATVPSRNNEEVAVKIIDLEEYSQDNLESIRVRERRVLVKMEATIEFEGRMPPTQISS